MTVFDPQSPDAATMVSGYRGPENVADGLIIPDIQDQIVRLIKSVAPLVILTGRLRNKKVATNYEFKWIEEGQQPRELVITQTEAPGSTTMHVTAGHETRVKAQAVLLNIRTREQVRVSADPSVSGQVPVVRNVSQNGAQQMVAGDKLVFTRAVYEDGADVGTGQSIQKVINSNYTETIRHSWGFTRRDENTDLFGGSDVTNTRRQRAKEHAKGIEYAFLFGQKYLDTSGTHYRTYTGGLEYWITKNIIDVSGTGKIDQREFDEILEVVMKYGDGGYLRGDSNPMKVFLCSSRWLTEFNWWAKDLLRYRPMDKTIGFGAVEYQSPHGRVRFLRSPVLDEFHPGYAFLLDMNHLTYRYHKGGDTMMLKNRQGNGIDGSLEELLSDVGLQVELDVAHAMFKGLGG